MNKMRRLMPLFLRLSPSISGFSLTHQGSMNFSPNRFTASIGVRHFHPTTTPKCLNRVYDYQYPRVNCNFWEPFILKRRRNLALVPKAILFYRSFVREVDTKIQQQDSAHKLVDEFDAFFGDASDPSSPKRLVVAVDVDEVLGSFLSALNEFIADQYSTHYSVSEYHAYEFFKIWGCSRGEANLRVHEFFKTSYFRQGIQPIPGAKRSLLKLSSFCNLAVVTSRQNAIKDLTIDWIEKHFPGLFQEIHFGNHFALNGHSRPKSEICRSLGAHVLIDDNPEYAMQCAEIGMKVLLFDYDNSYPWCKIDSSSLHPLVTKVHNWEEVEEHICKFYITT